MKQPIKQKSWTKMTAKQLAAATKEFEKPIRFEDTRPLTAEERAEWQRAKAGPTYSINVYNGKQRTVKLKLDEELLRRFGEFAKRNHMTLDEFIGRSLRSAIAFVD